MPIEGYIKDQEGNTQNVLNEPGELLFMFDYTGGSLSRIVGVESPIHDLGAFVHIVDDAEELETACEANISEKFTEDTKVDWLPPDGVGAIEFTNRKGKQLTFVLWHKLPITPISKRLN